MTIIINKLLAVLFKNFKLLNTTFNEEEVISKTKFSKLEQFVNRELVMIKVFDCWIFDAVNKGTN